MEERKEREEEGGGRKEEEGGLRIRNLATPTPEGGESDFTTVR